MRKSKSEKKTIKKKSKKNSLSLNSKRETVQKTENGEKKKRIRKPAEGSRYASVVLLIATIVVSLGFYFYGVATQKGINIEFGEMEDSWEYSK